MSNRQRIAFWIISVFLIVGSVSQFFYGYIVFGIICIIIGVFMNPTTSVFLLKKFKFQSSAWIKGMVLLTWSVALIFFQSQESPTTYEETGDFHIMVMNISASIGAAEQDPSNSENQVFKYNITLINLENYDMIIDSITPVLSAEFSNIVTDENVTVEVNKLVKENSSIRVSGEIHFNAKGLTKGQINSLRPFVSNIKIIEEKTIQNSF